MFYRKCCSLVLGLLSISWAQAAVVILNDGSRITGDIVQKSDQTLVIETAPGMRTELSVSDIREIQESAPRPEIKVPTTPSETQQTSSSSQSSPASSTTLDPKILADPSAFYKEMNEFVEKVKSGILSKVQVEDKKRVDLIRDITSDEANSRSVPEKVRYKLLSEAQGQKIAQRADRNSQGSRESYIQAYGDGPENSSEYKLYHQIFDFQQALNFYGGGEAAINYEEQITQGQKINLDDSPSPRGKELRDMMKQYLQKAYDLRNQIASQFPEYASNRSPGGLGAEGKMVMYQVKADKAFLFPYEDLFRSSVKEGIIQDWKHEEVSSSKPVILKRGEKVVFLENTTITVASQDLEVSRVKVTSDALIDLRTKKLLPRITLVGWMIADRLEPLSGK